MRFTSHHCTRPLAAHHAEVLGCCLVALPLSLCGCGSDKATAMDVACDETLSRQQCSRCRCLGLAGHCHGPVGCAACRAPYVFTAAANDTALGLGTCAVDCAGSASAPEMPRNALELNGKEWPQACFNGTEVQRFFIIGDWSADRAARALPTYKVEPSLAVDLSQ
eukprot:Skav216001  [mRNA]  locus=scaffold833:43367:44745:+ [translate_table: standard]